MITVVSGLPRSGTSLMMQMLAAGGMPVLSDGVRGADEDNPRGYFEYEKTKGLVHDNAWLSGAEGKVVKIITQLLPGLPRTYEYAVITMVRPVDEIIRSQAAMLRRLGRTGASLDTDALTDAYARQVERVQAWLHRRSGIRTEYVLYHEVLSDPDQAARKVGDFIGAPLETERMAGVVDGSLWRQRSGT